MFEALAQLPRWFEQQLGWVREAARRLYVSDRLQASDYDDLVMIAKGEGGALLEGEIAPVAQMPESLLAATSASRETIRLRHVADPIGINCLAPNRPLEFAETGLTVVYGRNGSGKSGYARILKRVCSSPHAEDLLPDAYGTEHVPQSCSIGIKIGDQDGVVEWTPLMSPHEELATVRFFDSRACRSYLSDGHEASYEPPILQVLTLLADQVAPELRQRVETDIGSIEIGSPVPPADLSASDVAKRVVSAGTDQDLAAFRSDALLSKSDQDRLQELDHLLSAADPSALLVESRNRQGQVAQLKARVEAWTLEFTEPVALKFQALRTDLAAKEQASLAAAQLLKQPELLPGVGSEVWKELWRHARAFSIESAYPGAPFPVVDEAALCVLCQQPLQEEARARLSSFEAYVAGAAERERKQAASAIDEAVGKLPTVEDEASVNTALLACGISEGVSQQTVLDTRLASERWSQWLREPRGEPPPPLSTDALDRLDEAIAAETSRAELLVQQSDPSMRKALVDELQGLKARTWLATIVDEMPPIIARRRRVANLRSVLSHLGTNAISTKKGQLTAALITEAFIDRVEKELERLGASSIRVKLEKQGTMYGRVPHKLVLDGTTTGHATEKVLSEGECKVAALATFLAHMTGDPHPSTFVFDDPINSLDDEYEDAVVRRLVELCEERQVIVFTHRISLLVNLADAEPVSGFKAIAIDREDWGTGQPGAIHQFAQRGTTAVSAIKNQLQVLGKRRLTEGSSAISAEMKAASVDLRNCAEDILERQLLSGVVLRFKRAITTKGKLHHLADITLADCERVERWITHFSKFEHLQPTEITPTLADPQEFIAIADEMLAMIQDIKDRR